jgi:hypothetical protein
MGIEPQIQIPLRFDAATLSRMAFADDLALELCE